MTPSKTRISLARKQWQERRVQWVAASPSLIHCSAAGRIRLGQGRDNEAHPRDDLSLVVLDLGDNPTRSCPGGRLILEAAVSDQRGHGWAGREAAYH